ncbi:ABC transporter permease [Halotalea alkalilenta]|uniref:ABC transporter permease n=1 Tax=Halotalea alkalilenta TaxID=376489 RepID=UPI000694CADC|nr:ABC transporter permease [Halotalea alkalilenta]
MMTDSIGTTPRAGASHSFRSLPLLLLRLRAYLALIFLVVLFSLVAPSFLSSRNLVIVAEQVAVFAILGIGMTFVILASGIDLSVGSIAGLSAMITGYLISEGLRLPFVDVAVFAHVVLVCAAALAIGTLVGMINGWFITRLRVTPFIMTLGMLYVARGAAQLVSDGATYGDLSGQAALNNEGFLLLGTGRLLSVPIPIWLMVALALVAIYVTRRTVFGRQVFAVGGNERAAELSGVRVNRIKIGTYAISGFCAALAGLIIASRLGAANPAIATSYELNAIAVVVLGGASLFGGVGTIGGTLVGAFVLGVLSNGMVLVGISDFWQTVITGAVIVLAVVVDQLQRRVEKSMSERRARQA